MSFLFVVFDRFCGITVNLQILRLLLFFGDFMLCHCHVAHHNGLFRERLVVKTAVLGSFGFFCAFQSIYRRILNFLKSIWIFEPEY